MLWTIISILFALWLIGLVAHIGGGLIHVSLDRPLHYPILCGALLAALGFLRRARLSNSGGVPLAFEDTLPDDVNVIPWS